MKVSEHFTEDKRIFHRKWELFTFIFSLYLSTKLKFVLEALDDIEHLKQIGHHVDDDEDLCVLLV